jgi:putative peptide zinc metalloprotease protein
MNHSLRLNPSLEVSRIDSASIPNKYILKIEGGQQFEVSKLLSQIVELVDGKRTIEDIRQELNSRTGKYYSDQTITHIVSTYLIPYEIIVGEGVLIQRKRQKSIFYINIPLFSQEFLRPITNIFQFLFWKPIFYSLNAIIFTSLFSVFHFIKRIDIPVNSITGVQVLLAYLMTLLIAFFHELGHSSACHYYGAKHGVIGLGVYLYFPVFYADVSDVWKLKRFQRAIVDIGGIYFQMLCIPFLFFFYSMTENIVFVYVIYTTLLLVITSMNPFLRFDGYWLISDITGLSNLRHKSIDVVKYFYGILLNKKDTDLSFINGLSTKTMLFLFSYSILSNIFFAYLIYQIVLFFFGYYLVNVTLFTGFLRESWTHFSSTTLSSLLKGFNLFFPLIFFTIPFCIMIVVNVRSIFSYFINQYSKDNTTNSSTS